MSMPKPISRRRAPLEASDDVLTLAQRLLEPLRPYLKWFFGVVLVVSLAVTAWGVHSGLQARKEKQAGAALAEVHPTLNNPAAAVQALEAVIKEYPGTRAARDAALYRAHLLYSQKKYGEAARAYESLIPESAPGFAPLFAESLSYCYEGLGDFKKAAQVLRPEVDKVSGPFQGELLRRLAFLYEKAGDPKEAGIYWRKLLNQPPSPGMIPFLKEKVAASQGAAPQ
jgi:tetratricopeptide (TPR) repeat protein